MAERAHNQVEIEALKRRLTRARSGMASDVLVLKEKLDVPSRLRSAVRENPAIWFGGSMAVGLLGSALFRRSHRHPRANRHQEDEEHPVAKKSLLALAASGLFALAKPALRVWLTNQIRQRFQPPHY